MTLNDACHDFLDEYWRQPMDALAVFKEALRVEANGYPPGMLAYLNEGVQHLLQLESLDDHGHVELCWKEFAIRVEAVRAELDDCPGDTVRPVMTFEEVDQPKPPIWRDNNNHGTGQERESRRVLKFPARLGKS
jgi:hypothetical protein